MNSLNPLTTWESVTAAERIARASMNQYHEDIVQPLYQACKLGSVTKQDVLLAETGGEALTGAHMQTVETVIMAPAPDLISVLTKLELGLEDGAFDRFDNDGGLRVLLDDIRRIANVRGRS